MQPKIIELELSEKYEINLVDIVKIYIGSALPVIAMPVCDDAGLPIEKYDR